MKTQTEAQLAEEAPVLQLRCTCQKCHRMWVQEEPGWGHRGYPICPYGCELGPRASFPPKVVELRIPAKSESFLARKLRVKEAKVDAQLRSLKAALAALRKIAKLAADAAEEAGAS